MRSKHRWVAAIVTAAAGLGGWSSHPAGAQSVEQDEAVVVSASGERITEGGSGTLFSLRLPDGAECPGSSAFEGWLVNSYMVHETTEPLDVTYDGLGPTPPDAGNERFRQPLFAKDTARFVSAPTAQVERGGEPGAVVGIPLFSLGVYTAQDLPAGRYHVGIACTLLNEIGRVWDAELVVRADPTDAPGGFVWEVVGAEDTDAGRSAGGPVALIGGAGILASIVVLVRRRGTAASIPSRKGPS